MRTLEQRIAQLRGAVRRARSRSASAGPSAVRPARLVLRIDDADLPGALGDGAPLTPAEWHKLLVRVIHWLGPVPVTVLAQHRADLPLVAELIRFTHRLECETVMVTDGAGIDRARAEELIDRGLGAVRVVVGGVTEDIHAAVVGNAATEATDAVSAFVAARANRGADLDIEVVLPWQGPAATEARAVLGWARQVGADGFRIVAPYRAAELPADPELLDELQAMDRPFHRTPDATFAELHAMVAHQDGEPGVLRAKAPGHHLGRRCPVGGLRLEISARGQMSCCPFKRPIGEVRDDPGPTWAGADAHLEAIRSCDRACAHIELAPAPILG